MTLHLFLLPIVKHYRQLCGFLLPLNPPPFLPVSNHRTPISSSHYLQTLFNLVSPPIFTSMERMHLF